MEKSHVSMEQKICIVTGKTFDSGALLMDTRMKNSLERHTVTGWGISPEVQDKIDEGFIVLVEIDPDKSENLPNGNISPEGAYRLGRTAYLKESVFKILYPEGDTKKTKVMFVDTKFINYLETIPIEKE